MALILKFNALAAYHLVHTALAPPNAGAHQRPQARQPGFNKITRTGTLSSLLSSVYYHLSYPIADQSLFLYLVILYMSCCKVSMVLFMLFYI